MHKNQKIEIALNDLKKGKIVLIYNSEEKETAMITSAEKINLRTMEIMKKLASSDICCMIDYPLAKKLGIYFLNDILYCAEEKFPILKKIVHGNSSRAIPLNHIKSKTGSSHKDKLMLIKDLIKIVKSENYNKFNEIVSAPGNFMFFIASEGLLEKRKGHTELSIVLAKFAGIFPIVIASTMRDTETGGMLSKQKAIKYAQKNNLIFLEDKDIIKFYKNFRGIK